MTSRKTGRRDTRERADSLAVAQHLGRLVRCRYLRTGV